MSFTRHPPPGFDFDRQEIADYLGCKMSTVEQWAWQRKNLPYTVVAGKAWYRQSDADRFVVTREIKVS